MLEYSKLYVILHEYPTLMAYKYERNDKTAKINKILIYPKPGHFSAQVRTVVPVSAMTS